MPVDERGKVRQQAYITHKKTKQIGITSRNPDGSNISKTFGEHKLMEWKRDCTGEVGQLQKGKQLQCKKKILCWMEGRKKQRRNLKKKRKRNQ